VSTQPHSHGGGGLHDRPQLSLVLQTHFINGPDMPPLMPALGTASRGGGAGGGSARRARRSRRD
jgi:hypothetical protein